MAPHANTAIEPRISLKKKCNILSSVEAIYLKILRTNLDRGRRRGSNYPYQEKGPDQ
jgi:hypothetical protein